MNLTDMTFKVNNVLIDAPSSVTGEIHSELDAAQREFEDRYAIRDMLDQFQESLDQGDSTLDKPSDWLRADPFNPPYYVYPGQSSSTGELTQVSLVWAPSADDVRNIFGNDLLDEGTPRIIFDGTVSPTTPDYGKFSVYPVSDGDAPDGDGPYMVRVPYIKRLDPPSTATAETWFMENAHRYLVFKASSECLSLNRDHEESQLYALKAERELKRLINQDKRSRIRTDTMPLQRDAGAPFNQRLR